MGVAGHLWTVWPLARERLRPTPCPGGAAIEVTVDDPDLGAVHLSGVLHDPGHDGDGPRAAVVVVHGLGGCAEANYMCRAGLAAARLGLAHLRLNLRGCDRNGGDFYHAGLSSDLAAVLRSPVLERFERLYLLGFSLGGHLVLKAATEDPDPRLAAVAAVCAPLDLERTVRCFDQPHRWLYRRHVLRGLADIYDQVARSRSVPVPAEEVRRVRTIREYDRLTVVPRFGFRDPEDYYARMSVGPRLGKLGVPALLVAAAGDPMVVADALRPALAGRAPRLAVRWIGRGGHVYFPPPVDLGFAAPLDFESQVLRWLLAR